MIFALNKFIQTIIISVFLGRETFNQFWHISIFLSWFRFTWQNFRQKASSKKKTQNTKSEQIAEEQKQKPVDQKQGNFTSGKVTLHPTLITYGWPFSSQDLIVDSPL